MRKGAQFTKGTDVEGELLLCCSRTCLDEATAARIDTLVEERIDWSRLMLLARRHYTVQLLYWHLKELPLGVIPQPVRQQLKHDFKKNTKENLRLATELTRAHTCFKKEGIPVIALKGPTLAQQAYHNIALRQFNDLDILIQKQDVLRVPELLSSLGYQSQKPWDNAKTSFVIQYEFEQTFQHATLKIDIDVHWMLWIPYFFHTPSMTDLLQRGSSISLLDIRVPCLSPEDQLLFSCVHGANHFWRRLSLVCDTAEIIRAYPGLQWERLMREAQTLHSQRLLLLGLLLARDLLAAPIPPSVCRLVLADPSIGALANDIKRKLFTDPTALDTFYNKLRVKERTRDRIGALVWWCVMPNMCDYEALPLPRPLLKLYYVLRPLQLAMRHQSWMPQLKGFLRGRLEQTSAKSSARSPADLEKG